MDKQKVTDSAKIRILYTKLTACGNNLRLQLRLACTNSKSASEKPVLFSELLATRVRIPGCSPEDPRDQTLVVTLYDERPNWSRSKGLVGAQHTQLVPTLSL